MENPKKKTKQRKKKIKKRATGRSEAREYRMEWYKKKRCFGIKQKFAGKRQIMSIGSPKAAPKKLSKAVLQKKYEQCNQEDGGRNV